MVSGLEDKRGTTPLQRPAVRVFITDWQRKNSQAPAELLLKPLEQFCDFRIATWDAGAHRARVETDVAEGIKHFVYCHMPPPSWHSSTEGTSVSWLPMWDQVAEEGAALSLIHISEPTRPY